MLNPKCWTYLFEGLGGGALDFRYRKYPNQWSKKKCAKLENVKIDLPWAVRLVREDTLIFSG